MKGTAVYHSPFGKMQLDWETGAVTALQLAPFGICAGTPNELTALVFRQLDEYFAGRAGRSTSPAARTARPFSKGSGRRCVKFPMAKRAATKQLAEAIGRPNACRAVGMANHANPSSSSSPATASSARTARRAATPAARR